MPKGLEDLNFCDRPKMEEKKILQMESSRSVKRCSNIEIYLVVKFFIKTYPVHTITEL